MGNPRPKLIRELAALLFGAAVFAWLAAAVTGGQASGFDAAVRGQIHAEAFPALTFVMRGFTMLGQAVFLVTLGGLVVWRLLVAGRRREAAFLAVSAIGAEVIDQLLKLWFHRTRPQAFFGASPDNYSFPSGHALVSFCFYLVLAEIFIEEEWPRGRRFGARAVAVLLTGCIGLSRVYLGVHYPTDVLAGYAAAIVWMAVLWSVNKFSRVA
jgi:undecaprenyl-diphosphatase